MKNNKIFESVSSTNVQTGDADILASRIFLYSVGGGLETVVFCVCVFL